jgi:hypothetical protein
MSLSLDVSDEQTVLRDKAHAFAQDAIRPTRKPVIAARACSSCPRALVSWRRRPRVCRAASARTQTLAGCAQLPPAGPIKLAEPPLDVRQRRTQAP